MKRIIILLTLVSVFLSFTGCNREEIKEPVNFYYARSKFAYDAADGVITAEIREGAGYTSQEILLSAYLQGPLDTTLTSPFPKGTQLISLRVSDTAATITLSDHFANLSGPSLMIACACLGKTCMELTQAETVQICCQTMPLDEKDMIAITGDTFTFFDDSVSTAQTE